jgi:hypothetical protein
MERFRCEDRLAEEQLWPIDVRVIERIEVRRRCHAQSEFHLTKTSCLHKTRDKERGKFP